MTKILKDTGWSPAMKELLQGRTLKAGIREPKGGRVDSDVSNVYIGWVHEFGKGNNPERSFLRSTFDENDSKYRSFLGRLTVLAAHADGKVDLDKMGLRVIRDVHRTIRAGISPEVSAARQKRKLKGRTTALINTKVLFDAIDYEVRDGV